MAGLGWRTNALLAIGLGGIVLVIRALWLGQYFNAVALLSATVAVVPLAAELFEGTLDVESMNPFYILFGGLALMFSLLGVFVDSKATDSARLNARDGLPSKLLWVAGEANGPEAPKVRQLADVAFKLCSTEFIGDVMAMARDGQLALMLGPGTSLVFEAGKALTGEEQRIDCGTALRRLIELDPSLEARLKPHADALQ